MRAKGYLLLARHGTVRTLRGEIYLCNESALPILEANNIAYQKVPLPVTQDEVDAIRNTPTVAL